MSLFLCIFAHDSISKRALCLHINQRQESLVALLRRLPVDDHRENPLDHYSCEIIPLLCCDEASLLPQYPAKGFRQ